MNEYEQALALINTLVADVPERMTQILEVLGAFYGLNDEGQDRLLAEVAGRTRRKGESYASKN